MTLVPAGAGEAAQPLFVGHPVISDQAELRIEWAGQADDTVRVHVHNPTPQAVTATLQTHPAAPGVPAVWGALTLAPGESAWLTGTAEAGFVRKL